MIPFRLNPLFAAFFGEGGGCPPFFKKPPAGWSSFRIQVSRILGIICKRAIRFTTPAPAGCGQGGLASRASIALYVPESASRRELFCLKSTHFRSIFEQKSELFAEGPNFANSAELTWMTPWELPVRRLTRRCIIPEILHDPRAFLGTDRCGPVSKRALACLQELR